MHPHQRRRRALPRQLVSCAFGPDEFQLVVPAPDQPVCLLELGDVAALSLDLLDLPVQREALALVDEHRTVTAILLDPPPEVALAIGVWNGPGTEVPFTSTVSFILCLDVHEGPPSDREVAGYLALRRAHALQGLSLLDVVVVSTERVRSLAISCDPDPVWFEPYHGAA